MSDTSKLETLILDLQQSVGSLGNSFVTLEQSMNEQFQGVNTRLDSMDNRLGRVEDSILDLREDIQSESVTTRSLLNQAFEHISDQIAQPDHKPTPSLVFRPRGRAPVKA